MTIKAKDEYCFHCGQMHPAWLQGCKNPPMNRNNNTPFWERTDRDWKEDFSHENGNYENKCCMCKNMFFGHKRRVVCKKCYDKSDLLLKAKNEIARSKGSYKDWEDYENWIVENNQPVGIAQLLVGAMEEVTTKLYFEKKC